MSNRTGHVRHILLPFNVTSEIKAGLCLTEQEEAWTMKRVLMVLAAALCMESVLAASAQNAFVKVESTTPGVEAVVVVAQPAGEFHITTRKVNNNFHADVYITGLVGVAVTPSYAKMTLGQTVTWKAVEELVEEAPVSGTIVLFRVDVEIDGVGEDGEDGAGASVAYADCPGGIGDPACEKALVHVKIGCTPSNRPENERINLAYPAGFLYVKKGNTYSPAENSYTAKEIHTLNFRLHGHALGAGAITATHNINGCSDTANFTVVEAKGKKSGTP